MSASAESVKKSKDEKYDPPPVKWGWVSKAATICVGIVLVISAYQNADFMHKTSENGSTEQVAMVIFGIVVIVYGQVVAYQFGYSYAKNFSILAGVGLFILAATQVMSMYTSSLNFNDRVFSTIQRQNRESPEYQTAMQLAQARQESVSVMQDRLSNMPANYATMGMRQQSQIDESLAAAERSLQTASNVNASSVGNAFEAIEDATGLTPQMVYIGLAILMSVICVYHALYNGVISGGLGQALKERKKLKQQEADEKKK